MRALAAAVLAVLVLAPGAEAVPPVNDLIAGAKVVSSLPYSDSMDTTEATATGDGSVCSTSFNQPESVWYRFTPAVGQAVLIVVSGTVSTRALVFAGTPGAGTLVNGCWWNDHHAVMLTGGTTYYVQIHGKGSLTFSLTKVDPPVHDDFNSAKTIPGLDFVDEPVIFAATIAGDDPPGNDNCLRGPSVWYRMTLPIRRRVLLTSHINEHVSVYTGPRGSLTQIVCGEANYVPVAFTAEAGQQYSIRVVAAPHFDPWDLYFKVEQGLLDPSISMTISKRRIVWGESIKLKVHLGGDFNYPDTANHSVWIYSWQRDGPDVEAARGDVDANGDWTVTLKPKANQSLEAGWAGDSGFEPDWTGLKSIAVLTSLKLNLTGGKLQKNGLRVYKKGSTPRAVAQRRPFKRGWDVQFLLDMGTKSGYRRIADEEFVVDGKGNVRIYMPGLPAGTRFRIRAQVGTNLWNQGNRTPWTYFQINR